MMQPANIRSAIAALGNVLMPGTLQKVFSLLRPEQDAIAVRCSASHQDVAYGPHERHVLDIYQPASGGNAPILLWVHGGGFLRGAKSSPDHPYDSHFGRFAALNGYLGVVINYRLAPIDRWPAGSEDIDAAVRWLAANAKSYGGDPSRIVLVGTSAGAAHCGGYIHKFDAPSAVRGAVLLSGLYGYTPFDDDREKAYYGTDAMAHTAMVSKDAVATTDLPLLVAISQFDPPRFQEEFAALVAQRFGAKGVLPRIFYGSGHNHYSLAYHIGTADTRFADEILLFANECCESDGEHK